MAYELFEPLPALQPYVKCFWTLEEPQIQYNRDPILPDSYVQYIFTCGAPLIWQHPDGRLVELPQVFIIGVLDQPLRLYATGHCQIIGVQCYAWAGPALLGAALPDRQGRLLAASDLWQRRGHVLAAQLRRRGAGEAVQYLQEYLCQPSGQVAAIPTPLNVAGRQLYHAAGNVQIHELAASCGLSLSQLERQFRQVAGILPKTLARLIRFETVRDTLVSSPSARTAELAQTLGYTDQAHLIRDFAQFAACTPGSFAAQVRDQHAL